METTDRLSLIEQLAKFVANSQVAVFLYNSVIMITGLLLLYFLSQDQFQFGDILFMIFWLVLIISLQPPEMAKMKAEPFEQLDILPSE